MSIEKTIGHTEPNFEVRMTERLWRSASRVYRHLLTQPAKRWRLETEVKAPVWMRDLGRLGQNSHGMKCDQMTHFAPQDLPQWVVISSEFLFISA